MRAGIVGGMIVAFAATLCACGGGDDKTSTPAPTSTTAASASPTQAAAATSAGGGTTVGLIAIGHSGLTGYGAAGSLQDDKQYSWATGANPQVNSIYQRLVAVRPEFKDHVANFAEGGTSADQLAFQAQGALGEVPKPTLVIIQTIDNDIRCDGSDPQHLPEFAKDLSDALSVITEKSPDSKILVLSQIGRPATYAAAIAGTPDAVARNQGTDMCAPFDTAGKVQEEHIRTLTSIIESYEAEQARVCATVPQCHTDNGAFSQYADSIDALAVDYQHLNIKGLTRAADTMWPTIAALLNVQ